MTGVALGIIHLAALAQTAIPGPAQEALDRYFTIQVMAAPVENSPTLLRVHDDLREKGHLVYYYPRRIDRRQYVRLRVGVFGTPADAKAYAEELRNKEGFDTFIAEANVTVARFRDRFRIVTTPSGIWVVSGDRARELYAPANGRIDIGYTVPHISPDGAAIVFYADSRIVKVAVGSGETRILRQAQYEDELLNSIVRWSPDGRYVTYLDAPEWELPTKLWIMRADGTDNRCLIRDDTGATKVKSFEWHPRENRIFYVGGYTYGTVSVGGSLHRVDLDGSGRPIVEADWSQGTEVHAQFRIADGLLQYRIAHHDPNEIQPRYSSHTHPLDE